jgi:hypothetical protein
LRLRHSAELGGSRPGVMNMKCPGFERLIDYLDRRLGGPEADRVAAHLAAGCAECAENRAWYEQVLTITASDDTVEPPQWATKRAFRIFEARRNSPRLIERIGQAAAKLVFDSLSRPALAGVRSTETVSRQLLYRAGDYSIDLQIAPAQHSRADLTGQVLKEGEAAFHSVAGLEVKLSREGELIDSTSANHMGEFTIHGVECGRYDLVVEVVEEEIRIEGLPVEQH